MSESMSELRKKLQAMAEDYEHVVNENADLRREVEKLRNVIIDGAVDGYKREHNLT